MSPKHAHKYPPLPYPPPPQPIIKLALSRTVTRYKWTAEALLLTAGVVVLHARSGIHKGVL